MLSEYVEGSANNKALELWNPTSGVLDLAGYSIEIHTNGSVAPSGTVALTGTLAPGAVTVVCNVQASAALLALSSVHSGTINFNGNDAIILRKGLNQVDGFGDLTTTTSWGTTVSSLNHTLRRKCSVVQGSTSLVTPFEPATEWNQFATDDFSNLGLNPCDTSSGSSSSSGGSSSSAAVSSSSAGAPDAGPGPADAGPPLELPDSGPFLANTVVTYDSALPNPKPLRLRRPASGGLVVGGNAQGQTQPLLVRMAEDGTPLWSRVLDARESLEDVQPLDTGFVVVGGVTQPAQFPAAWIARTDSRGNILWSQHVDRAAGTGAVFHAAAVTSDNRTAAVGEVSITTIFGEQPRPLVVMFDANGAMLWGRAFQTTDLNEGRGAAQAVAVNAAGDVMVAMEFERTYQSLVLALLASDGSGVLSAYRNSGDSIVAVHEMVRTVDGSFLMGAGFTNTASALGSTERLIKVDGTGVNLWHQEYNESYSELLAVTESGGVYLGGGSNAWPVIEARSAGGAALWSRWYDLNQGGGRQVIWGLAPLSSTSVVAGLGWISNTFRLASVATSNGQTSVCLNRNGSSSTPLGSPGASTPQGLSTVFPSITVARMANETSSPGGVTSAVTCSP